MMRQMTTNFRITSREPLIRQSRRVVSKPQETKQRFSQKRKMKPLTKKRGRKKFLLNGLMEFNVRSLTLFSLNKIVLED